MTQRWTGSLGQNFAGAHSVPARMPFSASVRTFAPCPPASAMSENPCEVPCKISAPWIREKVFSAAVAGSAPVTISTDPTASSIDRRPAKPGDIFCPTAMFRGCSTLCKLPIKRRLSYGARKKSKEFVRFVPYCRVRSMDSELLRQVSNRVRVPRTQDTRVTDTQRISVVCFSSARGQGGGYSSTLG